MTGLALYSFDSWGFAHLQYNVVYVMFGRVIGLPAKHHTSGLYEMDCLEMETSATKVQENRIRRSNLGQNPE